MTPISRLVVSLLAAALGLVALSTGASAHSDLLRSSPKPDEEVRRSVSAVTLVFASPVDPALADVVVRGKDGNEAVGEPVVRGSVVTVPVGPLDSAGRYAVAYRVVAADGHPVSGSYQFRVPGKVAVPAVDQPERLPAVVSADVVTSTLTTGAPDATLPWWRDLGPETGLGLAVLVIVATSLVRRARLREENRRG